jgi:hypothetical protein
MSHVHECSSLPNDTSIAPTLTEVPSRLSAVPRIRRFQKASV